MSLLNVRAKVLISSEVKMEIEQKYDMGTIPGGEEAEWRWTSIAVPFEDIYRIVEYSPSKCMLIMYNTEERILVSEKFTDLYDKWNKLRLEYGDFSRKEPAERGERKDEED